MICLPKVMETKYSEIFNCHFSNTHRCFLDYMRFGYLNIFMYRPHLLLDGRLVCPN